MVVWAQAVAGVNCILGRGPAGDAPATLSNGLDGSGTPKIDVDAAGNAIAVWVQSDDPDTNAAIWTSHYRAGTGWGAASQLSANSSAWANAPQVSLDPSGNAVVIWNAIDPSINSNH